jgi:hypothetical protein
MAALGSKNVSGPGLDLGDRMGKIKLTIVRLIHGMAEERPLGNSPVQVLFSRKNSRFRKKTLAPKWEKEKPNSHFSGKPTLLLRKPVGFPPPPC